MRELTIDELYNVAGGCQNTSCYHQESTYDDGSGGGSPPPASAPIPTPMIWLGVLDDISELFDTMTDVVSQYDSEYRDRDATWDQNSSYNDANTAPFGTMFMEMFGWLPSVQANPAAHYWDYLEQDIDPEFLMVANAPGQLTGTYAGQAMHMKAMGTDTNGNEQFVFEVNGLRLVGTWNAGDATKSSENEIVVTAGSWTFAFVGMASDPYNYTTPSPPPPSIPAGPAPPTPVDPTGAANTEIARINGLVDGLLASHGGHLMLSFTGPDGTTLTFDLAEFNAILDRYSIVGTNVNYVNSSGGAGQVIELPDGSFRTEINIAQLTMYASNPIYLTHLIIHEVAHKIAMATAYTNAGFQAHIAAGGTAASYTGNTGFNGSAELYRSESYVNNITKAIVTQIGGTVYTNAGGGYTYSGKYK